jgi:hypothetical protein
MYRILIAALLVLMVSCSDQKKKPDISHIKVSLQTERFEKELFSLDTTANMPNQLTTLLQKYPEFFPIFLQYNMGLTRDMAPAEQLQTVRAFLRQFRPLYDSAELGYPNFSRIEDQLQTAFRYVKYYYPNYPVPKIITLVGPLNQLAKLNSTYIPDFIGKNFVGISLQFYLGKNFSVYHDPNYIADVVPEFRSRRFDREYIASDVMALVADDIHPDTSTTRPLIEQMIEKGKQWFLIDHFLPDAPDSIKTGYTGKQLRWCQENEGNIWGYISKNTDLYSIDPETIQNYIGEAPYTQGMPETSPGNIGQWTGWRILQQYAAKHPDQSLQQILATPSNTIFQEAKYKPK